MLSGVYVATMFALDTAESRIVGMIAFGVPALVASALIRLPRWRSNRSTIGPSVLVSVLMLVVVCGVATGIRLAVA